ncbi:MAG: helical backbone metal receptor [Candidatus Muiribacteriota bacterium]
MSMRKISLMWIFAFSVVFVIFQLIPQNYADNNTSGEVTVIPLLPSVQEMVSLIGAGKNIVAVSQHSVWPEEVLELPKIGGYQGINYEKIALISPQYVLLTDALRETKENFEKMGINFVELKDNTVDEILNSIIEVGRLVDYEKNARKLVEEIKKKLTILEKKSEKIKERNKKVLIVVGFSGELKNLYVAGKNNFLNEIIEKIGYQNAYSGDLIYPSLSAEDIIKINPDAVIILDERTEIADVEREAVRKEWSKIDINANKNGKVGIINGDYVFLPGPRFIQTAEDFTEFLSK